MYEYKYSIGVRHKSTGERLKLEVWAEDVDAATRKLTGTLIGPECEYIWTGSGPIYETTSSSAVKERLRRTSPMKPLFRTSPRQGH